MISALWFFVRLALLAAIAVWLAQRPGSVSITWQGYLVETSVGVLILLLALIVALMLGLLRLWRTAWTAPRVMQRRRRRRARERGRRALAQGLVAVAAGDATSARRYAQRVGELGNAELTHLLSAQAAHLAGDDATAVREFTALRERPDTAFLGVRGLLDLALDRGDVERALELARTARGLQPKSVWAARTLFALATRVGAWADAESALEDLSRLGGETPERIRADQTALLIARADEAEAQGREADAQVLAQHAHDRDPGFAPATVRLARLLARSGRQKSAERAIEESWAINPNRDLAAAWESLAESGEPLVRYRHDQRLLEIAPDSVEARLVTAEAALDAGLWGEARGLLAPVPETAWTARYARAMARLEVGHGEDESAARMWLERAAASPEEPAWRCAACGTPAERWTVRCAACNGFDTLDPQRAGLARVAEPALSPAVLSPPSRAA